MARSTMTYLINEVRVRTNAGTASSLETHGTVAYWGDDQIQDVLDRHRVDIWRLPLNAQPTYNGGTVVYQNFPTDQTYLEETDAGTAVFYLEDGTNTQVGTALYNVDYQRGFVTFGSDTGGSAYYMTARSYDPDAAAAEIWRIMSSWYATDFDFSTDNHSVKKGDIIDNCMKMAAFFESRSKTGGFNVTTLWRSDIAY